MASENGNSQSALNRLDALPAEARQFFALCLSLEAMFPEAEPIGGTTSPANEFVRFRATPTLGFPPEEVSAVEQAGPGARIEVLANILGLHGPSSPLPPSFTERIVFAEDGGALRDFSDFFNHRLLALLFRVWKHYRHHQRYTTGAKDPISGAVAALFGMHGADADDDLPARTLLLPYAGILGLYSHSAPIVASVIRHYFGIPCSIEEFVPREIEIPAADRCMLGAANSELGSTTICGTTTRDIMGKFRIRLGPLNAAQFESLLPNTAAFRTLQDLIRLSIREPLTWDHAYVLAKGEAGALRLGETKLGWTGWMTPDPSREVEMIIG